MQAIFLKVWFVDPWEGVSGTFCWVLEDKTVLITTETLFAFFTVLASVLMVQNNGGQTPGVIVVAPNHILVIVFTHRRKKNS